MFKTIFVLESTWNNMDPMNNESVLPFVNEFAKQRGIKVYHQIFTDAKSFKYWLMKFNKICKGNFLLYVASHGNIGSIEGLDVKIRKQTIIDVLKKAKKVQFVHFGSCQFGNRLTLNDIMHQVKHLKWAAGYKERVDWVESTLFDLFIWSRISPNGRTSKGTKTHSIVDDLMNKDLKELAVNMQFRFFYRRGKIVWENKIDEV